MIENEKTIHWVTVVLVLLATAMVFFVTVAKNHM